MCEMSLSFVAVREHVPSEKETGSGLLKERPVFVRGNVVARGHICVSLLEYHRIEIEKTEIAKSASKTICISQGRVLCAESGRSKIETKN